MIHTRINIGYLSGKVTGGSDLDFTDEQIESLNELFNAIRECGVKAVVRFAYDYDGVENMEPDITKIEEHVEQLAGFFEQNQDIITVVEAGFLGPWGEMHTSECVTTENETILLNALFLPIEIIEYLPLPLFCELH